MAQAARNLEPTAGPARHRPELRVVDGGATGIRPPEQPEPGTRVVLNCRGVARHGVVKPYDRRWSQGSFCVRFDDGQWRVMMASDLTLEGPPRGRSR